MKRLSLRHLKDTVNISFTLCTLILQGNGLWAQEEKSPTENKTIQVEVVKNSSFEDASSYGSHEVRWNTLYFMTVATLDFSYERIFNTNHSAGVSSLINLNDDLLESSESYQTFAITPFYRFYFLNRKDYGARGLFVEVFASPASVEYSSLYNYDHLYNSSYEYETLTDVALGVGIGKKWINRKGYNLELFLGIGRYLIHDELDTMGKIGLSIGKRF